MPEISAASVVPSGVGNVAPGAPVASDPASAGPTFVTQLKTALASLTSVVARPKATPAAPDDAQAIAPATAAAAEAVSPTKETDRQSDLMPELLASLGLGLLPPTFAQTKPDDSATPGEMPAQAPGKAIGATGAPLQVLTPPAGGPLISDAQVSPPAVEAGPTTLLESSTVAQSTTVQQPPDLRGMAPAITSAAQSARALLNPGRFTPSATVAGLTVSAPLDQVAAAAPTSDTPAAPPVAGSSSSAFAALSSSTVLSAATDATAASAALTAAASPSTPRSSGTDSTIAGQIAATDRLTAAAPLASPASAPAEALQTVQSGAPQDTPQVQHHQTGPATAQVAGAAILGAAQSANQGGTSMDTGPGSGGPNSGGHKPSTSSAPDAVPTIDTETSSADALAAATTTVAPSTVAQPQAIQPSEVINQIAHQSDLYRLPGNRGVRIQLHPDDLGGVQVTVKYAVDGGIELHINTEHADTSALVQAGWTQLRDALAVQGISPDRLVMSVTSPTSASEMNFSSNGGQSGYGSEANAASSGQTGQGQQRQNPNEPREDRPGWTASPDSVSAPESSSRAASAAASAHIDYRV